MRKICSQSDEAMLAGGISKAEDEYIFLNVKFLEPIPGRFAGRPNPSPPATSAEICGSTGHSQRLCIYAPTR